MRNKARKYRRAKVLSHKSTSNENWGSLNVFARFYTTFERKLTGIERLLTLFDRVEKKSSGLSVHNSLFYVESGQGMSGFSRCESAKSVKRGKVRK